MQELFLLKIAMGNIQDFNHNKIITPVSFNLSSHLKFVLFIDNSIYSAICNVEIQKESTYFEWKVEKEMSYSS